MAMRIKALKIMVDSPVERIRSELRGNSIVAVLIHPAYVFAFHAPGLAHFTGL